MTLGSRSILTITLLIHEHGIAFHLFVYSFINVLFSVNRSFTSLNLLLKYFIIFYAFVNGIVFCLLVEPIVLFLYCLPDFIKLFMCSLELSEHLLNNYFEFFARQLNYLHLFGVSYWKFAMFLWWCHVSPILCDPGSLV